MSEFREVTIGPCRLINADCMEVLPTLSGVDCVVTDPPYGEDTHAGARTRTLGADSNELVTFASMTSAESARLFDSLVTVSRRWVVATIEWQHAAELLASGLVRLGVWIKPNSAPQLTGDRPATGWEAVAILHRPGKKRWNGGGRRAVWTFNRVDAVFHPTEKPLELILEFVNLFSDESELILDPFMGSGTTGIACITTGRKFIGIEKDAVHFATAVKRIQQAWDLKCSELPFDEPPKFRQRELLSEWCGGVPQCEVD